MTLQQQHYDDLEQEVYMTTLYSAANAVRGTKNYCSTAFKIFITFYDLFHDTLLPMHENHKGLRM